MEIRRFSSHIATNSIALLLLVGSALYCWANGHPNDETSAMSSIADKIAAHIAEDAFWGFVPVQETRLRLVLFVAEKGRNTAGFDVLAVVPEINETLEMKRCPEEPAIILQGWGGSDNQKTEPEQYLHSETSRFADFVAHAERLEETIEISSSPNNLFKPDAAFKAERIKQIKLALAALVHKRPLDMVVANFSKLTDQINVLVPSMRTMYTMSVVHNSCEQETVQVAREIPLASVSPGLRKKIEMYSTAEVIKSRQDRVTAALALGGN